MKAKPEEQTLLRWYRPEELIHIGFSRSRIVMMNEAHNGWLRCVRTRLIGQRIVPSAHAGGVRYLAMEALYPTFAEEANRTRQLPHITQSYLAQPEMRAFLQSVLDSGWTLLPYEATFQNEPPNLSYQEQVNWREQQQARNLVLALTLLPPRSNVLVWCGNGHHSKRILGDWIPMGYQFQRLSGIEPFVIDQTITVMFDAQYAVYANKLLARYGGEIAARGGTAGVVVAESRAFTHYKSSDAVLLSLDNDME